MTSRQRKRNPDLTTVQVTKEFRDLLGTEKVSPKESYEHMLRRKLKI